MNLSDVILLSSRAALDLQRADGSFAPGHDGPYAGADTPVRNTGHWLITFLAAFEASGDDRFAQAALRAGDYLTSSPARPMGASFFCRKDPEKDFANGLMGQAWAIEALVEGANRLGEESWRSLAREVFLLHPFDELRALWRYVNVDGSHGTYDLTFNHQLWFAAAGMLIDGPSGEAGARAAAFLDRLDEAHLRTAPNGRIIHGMRDVSRSYEVAKTVYDWRSPRSKLAVRDDLFQKGVGYHAFNLYAFALLHREVPAHPFWRSDVFGAVLGYVDEDEYLEGLETNKYGYPYNPPGFEVPFAQQEFGARVGRKRMPAEWVSDQLQRSFDFSAGLMTRNTEDARTAAARVYEVSRLDDLELPGLESPSAGA